MGGYPRADAAVTWKTMKESAQDLEATLLRIAAGARVFGLGWFVLLAVVAWVQHRDSLTSPEWVTVPVLVAVAWAVVSLVAVRRRPDTAVAPGLVLVDTLIAAVALLAPVRAGIPDVLFYGGLPLIVVGIAAIRGPAAAWSVAASLVAVVLLKVGAESFRDVVGSISQILTYLAGAFIFGWIERVLRSSEMARRLSAEAAARAEERVDISRHLHDSVLQTLALIRMAAEDPAQVTALARRQERDLREWLYGTPRSPAAGFADALRSMAAETEEAYRVSIDVVTVGDVATDPRVEALVAAGREAVVNAAKHAGDDHIAVYGEVVGGTARIFVRDRGRGFDPESVPEDRRGIAESIRGRLEEVGGRAEVHTAPGEGTEWRLEIRL